MFVAITRVVVGEQYAMCCCRCCVVVVVTVVKIRPVDCQHCDGKRLDAWGSLAMTKDAVQSDTAISKPDDEKQTCHAHVIDRIRSLK